MNEACYTDIWKSMIFLYILLLHYSLWILLIISKKHLFISKSKISYFCVSTLSLPLNIIRQIQHNEKNCIWYKIDPIYNGISPLNQFLYIKSMQIRHTLFTIKEKVLELQSSSILGLKAETLSFSTHNRRAL